MIVTDQNILLKVEKTGHAIESSLSL